jgi:Tol biopolymer transport system component
MELTSQASATSRRNPAASLRSIGRALPAVLGLTCLATARAFAAPGDTTLVSVNSDEVQGNFDGFQPSISADGRYVAFISNSTNLVAGDDATDFSVNDIFVRDRVAGTTTRVSVSTAGVEANAGSDEPRISANGRYVTFSSSASNLVENDTNGVTDVFVHDRFAGTTTRVSVSTAGVQGGGFSFSPSISGDGRYVAFISAASNLVAGDTNNAPDVFLHDRNTGETRRVSVSRKTSDIAAISADGRYVAFSSFADDLGVNNGTSNAYVYDIVAAITTPVVIKGPDGLPVAAAPSRIEISGDGRYVLFSSVSFFGPIVDGDTNGALDAFVHDRVTGETTAVSVNSAGDVGNQGIATYPYAFGISADGRYVVFDSPSTNLVAGDTNGVLDVFVHDRTSGRTTRVSVNSAGAQGNGESFYPAVNADGSLIAFTSQASNLVASDTNGAWDVFLHEPPASYSFVGFLPPVDNFPMSNVASAGRTIPVKWQLVGTGGAYVSNLATFASLNSVKVDCGNSSLLLDAIEETVSPGGTVLSYDSASNQFVYNWTTLPSWKRSCRKLLLELADGQKREAFFQFR